MLRKITPILRSFDEAREQDAGKSGLVPLPASRSIETIAQLQPMLLPQLWQR
jgi:hypothetical protein